MHVSGSLTVMEVVRLNPLTVLWNSWLSDFLQIIRGPSSRLRFILLVPLSCLHAWHFSFPLRYPDSSCSEPPLPPLLPPPPFVLFQWVWEGIDSWGSHWSLNFLHGWPMTSLYPTDSFLQVWINFGIENSLKLAQHGWVFENRRFFVSFWRFLIHNCGFIFSVSFGDFF